MSSHRVNEEFLTAVRDKALVFLRMLRAEWDAKKNIHIDAQPVRTWLEESYGSSSPVDSFLSVGEQIADDMRGFDDELARLDAINAEGFDAHALNPGYDGPQEMAAYRAWLWSQRENLDMAIIRWKVDTALFLHVFHRWERESGDADAPIDVYGLMEPDGQGNIECPVCGEHLAIRDNES